MQEDAAAQIPTEAATLQQYVNTVCNHPSTSESVSQDYLGVDAQLDVLSQAHKSLMLCFSTLLTELPDTRFLTVFATWKLDIFFEHFETDFCAWAKAELMLACAFFLPNFVYILKVPEQL